MNFSFENTSVSEEVNYLLRKKELVYQKREPEIIDVQLTKERVTLDDYWFYLNET